MVLTAVPSLLMVGPLRVAVPVDMSLLVVFVMGISMGYSGYLLL
jgi:hypothetical protein